MESVIRDRNPHNEPLGERVRKWRPVRVALLVGLLGAALVHPVARLLGSYDWRIDLITHFELPALIVTLIAAAVLMRWYPRVALGLGCLAIAQAVPMFR